MNSKSTIKLKTATCNNHSKILETAALCLSTMIDQDRVCAVWIVRRIGVAWDKWRHLAKACVTRRYQLN